MFLAVLFLMGGVQVQSTPVFSPMLWASPKVDTLDAASQKLYHVPICAIPQYDGRWFNISANLQAHPWSPDNEIVLYISLFNNSNFTGTPLAVNKDSNGNTVASFLLQYHLAMSDLYIQVRTGAPPTPITYTLAISVLPTKNANDSNHVPQISHSTIIANARAEQEKIKNSNYAADIINMVQLLFNPAPFSTITNALMDTPFLIDSAYCPTGDTYQLDVIVVATDVTSAFSSFVCTNFTPTTPCNAARGKDHADTHATSINHIRLSTQLHEYTNLEIATYGLGNYNAWNNFIFSIAVNIDSLPISYYLKQFLS